MKVIEVFYYDELSKEAKKYARKTFVLNTDLGLKEKEAKAFLLANEYRLFTKDGMYVGLAL